MLRHFGTVATRLPRSIDFGDSYVDVVLRNETIGATVLVVFFQMDKLTHGLKRIQLARRHGVKPPTLRAVLTALQAAYGPPDADCSIPPRPASGYQAATEAVWVRDGARVNAIFRDTTLEALEGCLFGPASGSCGLTGQLIVRIGPTDGHGDPDPCSLAKMRNRLEMPATPNR